LRGSLRRSSSTTSPTPRVQMPQHVARLVAWLVAPLVVDNSTSCRLVVDYFASAACPGASARHAAQLAARRRLLRLAQARRQLVRLAQPRRRQPRLAQARRRLLRLRRASGCHGTSRGSSRDSSRRSPSTSLPRAGLSPTNPPRAGSSSTTPPRAGSLSTTPPRAGSSLATSPPPRVLVPWHVVRLVTRLVAPLVVDHFASATRPGASARRAAHHAARRATRRRLLRLTQARRRPLRLHRASGCLSTSRGSSRDSSRHSSSTTLRRAGSLSTTLPRAG
jgi:hypothetical protein